MIYIAKYGEDVAADRKYLDLMTKNSLNRSISNCELLSKSLQCRYNVLQELDSSP